MWKRALGLLALVPLLGGCSAVTPSQHLWERQPAAARPAAQAALYCYRTLADVSCYDKPNPYGGSQTPVGDTPSPPPGR